MRKGVSGHIRTAKAQIRLLTSKIRNCLVLLSISPFRKLEEMNSTIAVIDFMTQLLLLGVILNMLFDLALILKLISSGTLPFVNKGIEFIVCPVSSIIITKIYLYNFDPLKPHFYIVKLGFTGVNIIFLISAKNIYCGYPLEPPRWGGSNEYPQYIFSRRNMKKYQNF